MGFFRRLLGLEKKVEAPKVVEPKKRPVVDHTLPKATSNWEVATVKRNLSSDRGFSFLSREGEDKDIYIHHSLLGHCGIDSLRAGQEVEVRWARVKKGLEAGDIRLRT